MSIHLSAQGVPSSQQAIEELIFACSGEEGADWEEIRRLQAQSPDFFSLCAQAYMEAFEEAWRENGSGPSPNILLYVLSTLDDERVLPFLRDLIQVEDGKLVPHDISLIAQKIFGLRDREGERRFLALLESLTDDPGNLLLAISDIADYGGPRMLPVLEDFDRRRRAALGEHAPVLDTILEELRGKASSIDIKEATRSMEQPQQGVPIPTEGEAPPIFGSSSNDQRTPGDPKGGVTPANELPSDQKNGPPPPLEGQEDRSHSSWRRAAIFFLIGLAIVAILVALLKVRRVTPR